MAWWLRCSHKDTWCSEKVRYHVELVRLVYVLVSYLLGTYWYKCELKLCPSIHILLLEVMYGHSKNESTSKHLFGALACHK